MDYRRAIALTLLPRLRNEKDFRAASACIQKCIRRTAGRRLRVLQSGQRLRLTEGDRSGPAEVRLCRDDPLAGCAENVWEADCLGSPRGPECADVLLDARPAGPYSAATPPGGNTCEAAVCGEELPPEMDWGMDVFIRFDGKGQNLLVGDVSLPVLTSEAPGRSPWTRANAGEAGSDSEVLVGTRQLGAILLNSQRPAIATIACAVKANWPVLLVGDPGSGEEKYLVRKCSDICR